MAKRQATPTTDTLTALRRFCNSPLRLTLLIAIGWQALMLVYGTLVSGFLQDAHNFSPLAHTYQWDSGWYASILHGSYGNPASPSPVFYPLFPLLVHLAQLVTFHAVDVLLLGFIINTASLWLALVALLRIADFFVDTKYRWWVVVLFLTSPAAIFLHLFYSEALFCAVVFLGILVCAAWAMGAYGRTPGRFYSSKIAGSIVCWALCVRIYAGAGMAR